MKQLTLRGFDPELEQRLEQLARAEGISYNQAALRLMRRGAGLGEKQGRRLVVGSSLDHLIGTWTDEDARAFEESMSAMETVDESLWR